MSVAAHGPLQRRQQVVVPLGDSRSRLRETELLVFVRDPLGMRAHAFDVAFGDQTAVVNGFELFACGRASRRAHLVLAVDVHEVTFVHQCVENRHDRRRLRFAYQQRSVAGVERAMKCRAIYQTTGAFVGR